MVSLQSCDPKALYFFSFTHSVVENTSKVRNFTITRKKSISKHVRESGILPLKLN